MNPLSTRLSAAEKVPLPDFNADGDLPPGIYAVTSSEVLERFGAREGQREVCGRRLAHVLELARRTGCLRRLVVFGSFVTAKPEPNDVDVILIMDDRSRLEDCPMESRGLFDHATAQARYGTSVFWMRPALLIGENVEEVSDLRQSRRLDEGGAAQSRTALRAALRTAITTTTRSGLSLPARNEWGESRREGRL